MSTLEHVRIICKSGTSHDAQVLDEHGREIICNRVDIRLRPGEEVQVDLGLDFPSLVDVKGLVEIRSAHVVIAEWEEDGWVYWTSVGAVRERERVGM